jgi:hypothetical protein
MIDEPLPQASSARAVRGKLRADTDMPRSSLGRRTAVIGVVVALCGLAAVHFGALNARTDDVPWQEAQHRAAALAGLSSIGAAPVAQAEESAAVDTLGLPPVARAQIASDVQAGRVRLVWLSLYDSDAEDGDAVLIRSGTFTHSMVLTHAPVAVPIPVVDGAAVTITGTVDGGGGGVTVGMVTPQGPLPLPPLSVGQTITLPLLAK